jgi:CheY-like chemotaxis protein
MDKSGPIIIIDDSLADRRIYSEIFKKLNYVNELVFFEDGTEALEFLNTTDKIPFLLISDINMPRMSGFDLRSRIYENEKLSSMCFLFYFSVRVPIRQQLQKLMPYLCRVFSGSQSVTMSLSTLWAR